MKKAISILLTLALLAVSALALVGCPAEEETPSESSVKELTAKEIFIEGLSNAFGSASDMSDESGALSSLLLSTKKDFVAQIDINITKLEMESLSLSDLSELKIQMTESFDVDSQRQESAAVIDFLGESLPMKTVTNGNTVYLVDMLGINEKPIRMSNYLEDETDSPNAANDILEKYGDISKFSEAMREHFAEATEKVLSAHAEDGVYTSETKPVTLEGKEYKDATVITFTISGGKVAQIANELVDELLAHEDIDALLGEDFDKNVYLDNFGDLKEIRIKNIISEKKTVGLDFEFESTEDPDEEDDDESILTPLSAKPLNESAESDTGSEKADDDNLITVINTINCVFDGENYYINLGTMKNGAYDLLQGCYTIKSVRNAETNEYEFVVKENTNVATTELISFRGTKTDTKTEGTFTIKSEYQMESAKISFEGDAKSGKLSISEWKSTMFDPDFTYDYNFNIQLVYTIEDNKLNIGGKFYNEDEAFTLEATFDTVVEFKDVTIEEITDYIEEEDFITRDIDALLSEKYPKIAGFLESMSGGEGDALLPYFVDGEYDSLTLLLPDGFVEQEFDQFDAVLLNEELEVLVFASEFGFDETEAETLDEFINSVLEEQEGLLYEVIVVDGVTYVIMEQDGTHFVTTAYEGTSSFWLVMYNCPEYNFSDYQEKFIAWAAASIVLFDTNDTDIDF